jgi:hypothetical protein
MECSQSLNGDTSEGFEPGGSPLNLSGARRGSGSGRFRGARLKSEQD